MNNVEETSVNAPVLLGLNIDELKSVAVACGLPAFAGKQIADWLYQKHVGSIEEMTNLSKAGRERLAGKYRIGCRPPVGSQRSKDGTIKYLFPTSDGHFVETVYIPDGVRATLCVSCQVGCKMHCAFCMTGRQGYVSSLSVADILNQIYSLPERDTLTNIVFMGQGEPCDNLDAVLRATEVLTAGWGYAWSPRRITVSTVGLRKGLERFLRESECHLAISLHHPYPEGRSEMMPAEKAFGITDIVNTLLRYDFCRKKPRDPEAPRQRRLSFEYIVFDGINDSMRHADALVAQLRELDCRVNLIRFHPIPGTPFRGVSEEKMTAFRDRLTGRGLFATIRASRGKDIQAACGLLTTAEEEKKKEQQ